VRLFGLAVNALDRARERMLDIEHMHFRRLPVLRQAADERLNRAVRVGRAVYGNEDAKHF